MVKTKIKVVAISLLFIALTSALLLVGCGVKSPNNGGVNTDAGNNGGVNTDATDSNQNGGSESIKTYIVTFNSDGGTPISPQTIKSGERVQKPSNPEKQNYVFLGWYIDGEPFNFETHTVSRNITLTAKWRGDYTPSYTPC